MTKLEIFKKLMDKAKSNGYAGPDYELEIGFIINGHNINVLIFREDFAKAIWPGEGMTALERLSAPKNSPTSYMDSMFPEYVGKLKRLVIASDKWKYLEENAL